MITKTSFTLGGEEVKGVGVMKDEELQLDEIEVSHTLGGTVSRRERSGWVLV